MKLYFTRHGESVDDIEDCYGGAADFPLTDRGRNQANAIAEQLRAANIDAVISSPLRRAAETAKIIADQLGGGIEVTVVEDLRERNSYGVLSGVNKEKARQIFGYILKDSGDRSGYSPEPLLGAEDFELFITRVQRALAQVTRQASERGLNSIVVVTHGTFTRTLFEHVLEFDESRAIELGTVNVVDYQPAVAKFESAQPIKD